MRVLVIGSGGREHAIGWRLSQSPRVETVLVAPGNGGTTGSNLRSVELPSEDAAGVAALIEKEQVGLTVVGPEAWLAAGLVDDLTAQGHRCFGPTQTAAELEASKAFAKRFMARHRVPTARGEAFTDITRARAFLDEIDYPVVLKASGLAAGKGVLIPDSPAASRSALERLMIERQLGAAGDEVVIEERLLGDEASVIAFCDGEHFVCMPVAQDHKRVFDGDTGPNTGGMGAYAPAPVVSPEVRAEIEARVIAPTVNGMAAEGRRFVGFLFVGLMITDDGPKVLEYNVRLGDPEAQVLMPLLATDLLEIIEACLDGDLTPGLVRSVPGAAATVVAAAGGYPGGYAKGRIIRGLAEAEAIPGVTVFHAGTRRRGREMLTCGGRVLAVTALGDDLESALARAYDGIEVIDFETKHYRRDIGWRAVGRAVGNR